MDFFSTSIPSGITCLELGSATQYLKNRSALDIFHEIISSILKSKKISAMNEKLKNNTTVNNKQQKQNRGFFLLYQRNLAHPLSSSLPLRSALL